MTDKPKVAGKSPIPVDMETGKKYAWCSCGFSENQPFCNGAHRETSTLRPTVIVAEETKTAYMCNCKMTKNPPYCDGTHKSLTE